MVLYFDSNQNTFNIYMNLDLLQDKVSSWCMILLPFDNTHKKINQNNSHANRINEIKMGPIISFD